MVLRQQLENLHLDPQEQDRKRANWEWRGAFKTSMLNPGHPPPNPSQTVTNWGPSVKIYESVETILKPPQLGMRLSVLATGFIHWHWGT